MQILHIDLRSLDVDYADLRYSGENLNAFAERWLPLAEIQDLIDLMERDYYVALPEGSVKTGRRLYEWLDGSDRWLSSLLGSGSAVLAIATGERLAHLPWEVMHDGQGFLVGRSQPVVPVRWQGERLTWQTAAVPNRPLQLLFMATSPVGVKPVLDFEAEEGRILTATARQPLTLAVEESGCLSELAELLTSYGPDYFDVVHLSGHASISDKGPRFITETETGDRYDASPQDIAKTLQFRFPPLVFLSGCHTGQAGRRGEVPSMAAAVLEAGAGAVLGWGRPVRDVDGILAAEALYKALAGAGSLPEALAKTYQAMIEAEARDWHLLRLYVAGAMPRNLVTPLKTKGRQRAQKPSMATDFLDAEQKVKVPKRESFVGRRRPLQACLRALRDLESTGVLIHGMGGLGKSSLAARLCDRLSDFERVVWFGPLDEAGLVNKLAERVRDPNLRQQVQDHSQPLKYRLRDLFEAAERDFLLVLDDFEANLEPVGQGFRLKASKPESPAQNPARAMEALMWALEAAERGHRVVITCRYDFEFDGLRRVYKQPLEGLAGADLRKKRQQLAAFRDKSAIEKPLQERALRLADGNPRLLEWLDKILCNPAELGAGSVVAVLDELERKPKELRERVLAAVLVQQMDESMRKMLARARVYELPVPREAIAVVCEGILQVENLINQAIAIGLLEKGWNEELRVPRILPLELIYEENLLGKAARKLAQTWSGDAVDGEAKVLEIHRIAMKGKEHELSVSTAVVLSQRWLMRGQARETISMCEKAFYMTEHPQLLLNIAIAKSTLGLKEESLSLYKRTSEMLKTSEICKEGTESYLYIQLEINNRLSDLYDQQGQTEQALAGYLKSLVISGRLRNKEAKAGAYRKVAGAYADIGKLDKAITSYKKALWLVENNENSVMRGSILHDIARVYFLVGDINLAMDFFNLALAHFKKVGDLSGFHLALHELGRVFIQQEKYGEVLPLLEKCLNFFESAGDVRAEAKSLHEIGHVLLKQGKAKKAIVYLKKALKIETQQGDLCDQVITFNTLAGAYLELKFVKKSSKYVKKSLHLIERFPGGFSAKADTFGMWGAIQLLNGSGRDAIDAFRASREYFLKAGNSIGAALAAGAIGNILYEHFKESEGALEHLEECLRTLDELDSPKKEAIKERILFIRSQ
ncbi:tetratricopeptide repeat protein [Leptolyngbya sp. BC1307]|uniref:tetratricopeptide repeat protein n=1 Tax=Leptolyngbya sp. BC1307 TaxID=2029589 RepID=UPI000EFA61F9|nr:tetratricopeptide repeat protein [Leptolyngbya sp. BC1307]